MADQSLWVVLEGHLNSALSSAEKRHRPEQQQQQQQYEASESECCASAVETDAQLLEVRKSLGLSEDGIENAASAASAAGSSSSSSSSSSATGFGGDFSESWEQKADRNRDEEIMADNEATQSEKELEMVSVLCGELPSRTLDLIRSEMAAKVHTLVSNCVSSDFHLLLFGMAVVCSLGELG